MRYANLRAEMVRHGVTSKQLADALGVREATISYKLNGSRFYFEEAYKIKSLFFQKYSLEYLFGGEDQQNTA